jgi:hypothetical protein
MKGNKPFFPRPEVNGGRVTATAAQDGASLLEAAAVAALGGYCAAGEPPADAAQKAVLAAQRMMLYLKGNDDE